MRQYTPRQSCQHLHEMENVFNVTKSNDDLFFKTIAGTPTPTHVIKVEKVNIQEEKYYIFNVIKVMV